MVMSSYSNRDRLERAGVPRRAQAAVQDLGDTEAVRRVRAFLEGDESTLVLSGPRGVGKTVAAASAVLSVGWGSALFVRAADLARIGLYDRADHERLRSALVLVVDDLGVEYSDAKGYFRAMVDGLIDQRHGDMSRTLITTNMRAADFKAAYGERVADRIRESGSFVELVGESLRTTAPPPPVADLSAVPEEGDAEAFAGGGEPVDPERLAEVVSDLTRRLKRDDAERETQDR